MIRSLLESFGIAITMYSTIPIKAYNWTEKNLRNAMLFFPVIGLFLGGLTWLLWLLCDILKVSPVLFGILAVLGNVFLTGGIHLDGFCDTADALYSRRSQEEKLKILKDPHCGPFAVFSVILVLLTQFAAYTEFYTVHQPKILPLLTGGYVLSRCLSGCSVALFPCTPTSSLVKTFGEAAGAYVGVTLLVISGISGILLLFGYQWLGGLLLLCTALVFWGYYRMQKKQFGGLTGDLAGYFLVLCETVWALITALGVRVLL